MIDIKKSKNPLLLKSFNNEISFEVNNFQDKFEYK